MGEKQNVAAANPKVVKRIEAFMAWPLRVSVTDGVTDWGKGKK